MAEDKAPQSEEKEPKKAPEATSEAPASAEKKVEEKKAEAKPKKRKKKGKIKRKLSKGNAYIRSTYNNTIVTITDLNGNTIAWGSAGHSGFKGPKKATPYAATIITKSVLEKIRDTGLSEVDVYVKGVGGGREAAIRALVSGGISINVIRDVTPTPHNGCRPKKARRV